jgi:hypothetical protein
LLQPANAITRPIARLIMLTIKNCFVFFMVIVFSFC